MPYCKKCRTFYKEKASVCPKCGSKLTAGSDSEAFLISVKDGYQTDMVEGSLRTADIPYEIKRHGGPSGFSRYDTKYDSLGADFYVPPELLSRAAALLPPVDGAEKAQEEILEDAEPEKAKSETSAPENGGAQLSPFKRTAAIVIFLLLLALAIFGVDAVMNNIRAFFGYK